MSSHDSNLTDKTLRQRRTRVDVAPGAFNVRQWCDRNSVSRTQLYRLWAEGRGPRFFWLGKERRISIESDIEWRAQMQADSDALAEAKSEI
jgi:hypothetical protein